MDFFIPVAKSPEEIFPLEVWGLILDNLKSGADLANCYRTCQAFASLLKPKRTAFLMLEVFPVLCNYLEQLNEEEKEDKTTEDDEEEKEATNNIIKLRLVSQSWKESVDNYYQNHPGRTDIIYDVENGEVNTVNLMYNFNVASLAKLDSLASKNFPSDSNPFVTRYVRLNDTVLETSNAFWRKQLQKDLHRRFRRMLKAFGSRIWHCTLRLTSFKSEASLYKRVKYYFSLLPNLRSLELCVSGIEKKVEKLEGFLAKEPVPKLLHLSKITMKDVPVSLSAGILRGNEQLRKLSIEKNSGGLLILPDSIVNVEISRIEEVSLVPSSKNDILQLQKANWPLKFVQFYLEKGKIATVFQAVSAFKVHLEHLILNQNKINENIMQLQMLRLDLPNLKKFELCTSFKLRTIDFLAECTALEELDLRIRVFIIDDELNSGATSLIQFKGYFNCMHTSNIWELLPKLQSIKIQTAAGKIPGERVTLGRNYRFTRRQHEKYRCKLANAQM